MKRHLTLVSVAATAAALALTVLPATTAQAVGATPCAQMGHNVTIAGDSTPTCTLLYTSGPSSILIPADGPRIVYGVVVVGSGTPYFLTQSGKNIALNAKEANRWVAVGSTKGAQTLVKGEIVSGKIGTTWPYLYITDDAITDRFSGKTFIGRTTNSSSIQIWTRIDWAGGLSDNGGLRGVIANYKQNVKDSGTCRPAMTKSHADMVKARFGQKGKLEMGWRPGYTQSAGATLTINTEKNASFARPAPTALLLTTKVWSPGKLNFTLPNTKGGLIKILVQQIQKGSVAQKCSLH